MKLIKDIIKSKRGAYLLSTIVLILFATALNLTFSIFINRTVKNAANITVNNMKYNMTLNGIPGTILKISKNSTPATNIGITALNKIDSKYELIYKVCSDSSCKNYLEKPDTLIIEYSSRTIDDATGTIVATGSKNIRIVATNTANNDIYIELDINAGYTHNTLNQLGLINSEFNEEDVTIAAIIDGEIKDNFPTTNNYTAQVECTAKKAATTATGTATWDGNKWVVNIINATTSKTYCNVSFKSTGNLYDLIIAQGGGIAAIEAKGNPNFAVNATASDSGIYATEDEYGTSYYYRGLKEKLNNNLIFAGFQWKIIRTNGDGSIRIIYNGECPNNNCSINSTGSQTQLNTLTQWNNDAWDTKKAAIIFEDNVFSEAIETLNNWYDNLSSYSNQIIDNLYCNEANEDMESNVFYQAYTRLNNNKTPTLKCPFSSSYTVYDRTNGNRKLDEPIGLITADELSMAGLVYEVPNTDNYLFTGEVYWTITPSAFIFNEVAMFSYSGNMMAYEFSTNEGGLRPVISLTYNTNASGTGTALDPYKVL